MLVFKPYMNAMILLSFVWLIILDSRLKHLGNDGGLVLIRSRCRKAHADLSPFMVLNCCSITPAVLPYAFQVVVVNSNVQICSRQICHFPI